MRTVGMILGMMMLWPAAHGQGSPESQAAPAWADISLNDLHAFADPGANWSIVAEAWGNYTRTGALEKIKEGKGVVINHPSEKARTPLVTKQHFGDIEISLEFMMAKGSNSGVYVQGKYEIQLADSWTKLMPASGDCGGVYQRWDRARPAGSKGYEGIPPLQNACRAPGLWQHLVIRFRAPRFNAQGEKTGNARFEEVYLNGVLVQSQVEVTGPTRSPSTSDKEVATGPLLLQGDHGKVAFRNIRYRPLHIAPVKPPYKSPIIVTPGRQPYLLRSFMEFGGQKLVYVISMGDQSGLNYSYDLSTGALFQVWRGRFLDVTDMWHSRGQAQLALPLGAVVPFSAAPGVAVLADKGAPWPDTVATGSFREEGYELDADRVPTFSYLIAGVPVKDRIAPTAGRNGFERTITVASAPPGLYSRIAAAATIEQLGRELYRIDGACYIHIDKRYNPQVRSTGKGAEMLVSLAGLKQPFTYSIIW
ncbi:3-keto-disaccharide hydrolase [Chitinophaga alhagiae]|uniref:3-keto-disaccharide hydrolase n=1 Tax=Chitinophaga alhagiae TaxID=2203219 RepID=UPI00130052C0|nr:DUF1080 domain-containing protein [Chitinophaga alhagiae]